MCKKLINLRIFTKYQGYDIAKNLFKLALFHSNRNCIELINCNKRIEDQKLDQLGNLDRHQ